jgi:hypothetical protein
LRDQGLVVIAAAEDTGGEAAAGTWYDQANCTYVTLVDDNHTISSLFNLVNVPSAVWIDENGRVVRVDEGTYAAKHSINGFEFGRDDYAGIVRDWVENGAASRYVGDGAARSKHLRQVSRDEALADAAFKLGVYFFKAGNRASADRYWEQAQRLNPDSWNYHRQDWTFDGEAAARANWAARVQQRSDKAYYEPIAGLD